MTKIITWLRGLEHRSFETITSGLSKMRDELHSLASFHGLKTVEKAKSISQLGTEIEAHKAEAQKAIIAATNIGGLLA
jgi:hypothetical protein